MSHVPRSIRADVGRHEDREGEGLLLHNDVKDQSSGTFCDCSSCCRPSVSML